MKKTNSPQIISFWLCIGIFVICSICVIQFSGFRYEPKKFKQFVVTIVIVILSRYMLWEHLEFAVKSLYMARAPSTAKSLGNHKQTRQATSRQYAENTGYSPLEYLKLRLKTAKAEFKLSPRHKDETLNVEYQQLTRDLWLFGKYFALVLLMIVYSRSPYGYFNTKIMKTVLMENRLNDFGLRQMKTIYDLYRVINGTLTESLNQGSDYRGERLPEAGWVHFEMAKLMGVVRLQQIRLLEKSNGMKTLRFDEENYMPEWRSHNRTLYYVDKYWRIYYPWLSKTYKGVANWLMAFTHIGSLYTYSENNGYVALLARDQKNSETILRFLRDTAWLDSLTAAVLIDFTLYSVDANMFTIVSILVEQTPFGSVIWQLNLQSVVLLTNLDQLSYWWWLLLVIYIIQLMDFCKALLLRWWFIPEFFQSPWNYVDLSVLLLNLAIIILLLIRESFVKHVMVSLESANKLDYIDFRVASWFDYLATIGMGFLVALTTVRLWKILQFSSVFRLFSRALSTASGSLVATIMGIHIFLFAIGFAAQIVNGSQTEIFSRYLKSLTSIMSFSFGFNSHTSPEDLSHGGNILGFILYLILMFVVAIFLINMFITLICDHFAAARAERDNQPKDRLSYGEFLLVEYGFIKEFVSHTILQKFRSKPKISVLDNVERKLQKLDDRLETPPHLQLVSDEIYEADMLSAQRMREIVTILELQMDILHRQIMLTFLEWDSDEEQLNESGETKK